ncbi:UDP-2,4-diacetamido-2,4,6-trideoxy-beta-L-altropyranose hydrolase [Clostridiaceae bacterium 35-E11]
MDKKVFIRVDGSSLIGMGHIMRCITLAKELLMLGLRPIFISSYHLGIERLKEENFEVIETQNNQEEGFYSNDLVRLERESHNLNKLINEYGIEILIVDTYNVCKDYFIKLKNNISKLIYIDDLNSFPYSVDYIVNGNYNADKIHYTKYFPHTELLLGNKYTLMRKEFRNIPRCKVKQKIESVMITTGSTDNFLLSEKFLITLLSQYDDLKINIVVGKGYKNIDKLIYYKCQNNNIRLYSNERTICNEYGDIEYKSMSSIMMISDIAFSAGGSTLYELMACGIPTIGFIIAENQQGIVNSLATDGYILNLGWYIDITKEKIISEFDKLYKSYETRKFMEERSRSLVDGRGAERVAKIIKDIMQ